MCFDFVFRHCVIVAVLDLEQVIIIVIYDRLRKKSCWDTCTRWQFFPKNLLGSSASYSEKKCTARYTQKDGLSTSLKSRTL